MRSFLRAALAIVISLTIPLLAAHAQGPVVFHVRLDPGARKEPASGRLIVLVHKTDGKPVRGEPIDGPSWDNPQPLFGIDVKELAPGESVKLDDAADGFPVKPGQLEPGSYVAQARFDVVRRSSQWRLQDGNLFSQQAAFVVEKGKPTEVFLVLNQVTRARPPREDPRVEFVEVPSPLLTKFYGTPIALRAAVIKPADVDPSRKYAAIYNIPGFGGDLGGAFGMARQAASAAPNTLAGTIAANCFQILLDPESSNGHTLFADSANNGPRGEALVKELIPALEARFPLARDPAARLLRGHSSGGWSAIWLAITYPEMFGAAWSSAPDPVDFRKFQSVNIYTDVNMYRAPDAQTDWCSYRKAGKELMTIRQENGGEQVIGPSNTSAQQWDSWLAVFGPRDAEGHPAALFDPQTGDLDHAIAEQFRKYDIAELVRANPEKLGPIFRRSIRLYVGDQDNFYLNEAVALLKEDLDRLYPEERVPAEERFGVVKIIPELDHGTIFSSSDLRAIPADMVRHLRSANLVK